MRQGADLEEIALRLLGQRDHSREELRRKLLARGGAEEAVAAVLSQMARLGYQDDARYAQRYAEQRARRGIGRARLVEELAARGVARDLAARVVGEAELEDEASQALGLARERARLGRAADQTGRFLLRRGFPASVVRKVLREAYRES